MMHVVNKYYREFICSFHYFNKQPSEKLENNKISACTLCVDGLATSIIMLDVECLAPFSRFSTSQASGNDGKIGEG